ncbi:efflux RND transporter periplasmic adaptor subunit [Methylocystis sp. MJC1]|jgi:HlyD family secretion protein|uniref:efflux RND transporter periplasmic adaptor subunit n=1 Tax=Methylocystis sp. MJC1 TaxID=2654282 RepID=UPI0013ECB20F|nr:efflux RND transporter periplasmic adaptor subunit [Methylocystis sp. MJC1]KAF2989549.1 Macrolide export protein MacA [Methylocystis sp. MJC1]MBU6528537.1 efflux RND transporter periplasmic adaptor subunit [Methylocystis sp. MJC1]UZX11433.1 efflux RND transporter periplasmic adaptor subunit [Methylocystis sp. MJC1]
MALTAEEAAVAQNAYSPKSRRWLVPVIIGLAAAAFAGVEIYRFVNKGAGVRYLTQQVTRGPVVKAVTTSGTVNPVITVQVGTYVSGVIQARYCDYNTRVRKGQVCAKIDPRPYQVVVDQDKATLGVGRAQMVKDQADLTYAKIAYDRNRRLAATKSVSLDVLDASKSALDRATAQIGLDEATIALQEAQLRAAEINLGYTDIVSPVDGTVVSRSVEMGQTVAASFQTPTLFLVATDLTTMQVDTNVSESDIGAIRRGHRATFTVESFPNRTFSGEVTEVRQSPQTIQNVVTYDVVVGTSNGDLVLKPGMTATTRVIVDERRDVLRIPDQAFRYQPGAIPGLASAPPQLDGSGGVRLWVLRDGAPKMEVIIPGLDDDSFTEVLKGDLRAGDQIIVGEEAAP